MIGECIGILRLNIQGMNLKDIDFLKNLSLDYLDMSNVEVENNIFDAKVGRCGQENTKVQRVHHCS